MMFAKKKLIRSFKHEIVLGRAAKKNKQKN